MPSLFQYSSNSFAFFIASRIFSFALLPNILPIVPGAASGVEKKKVYLNFIYQFFKSRSFIELFKDLFTLIKMFLGVFIK